jgi:hypothetical protein
MISIHLSFHGSHAAHSFTEKNIHIYSLGEVAESAAYNIAVALGPHGRLLGFLCIHGSRCKVKCYKVGEMPHHIVPAGP